MIEITIVVISLIILLIIDLIVVAARSSYVHTTRVRLLTLREEQEQEVSRTLPLIFDLPRVRASFNFMLVIIRFLMVSMILYSVIMIYPIPTWGIVLVVIAAALVLFWLEWIVEMYTMRTPELWAMRFTGFTRILTRILLPIISLPMTVMGDPNEDREQPGAVTEDELRTLVDVGQEDGYVEEIERRMIQSVFQLSDTLVREIMVPRIDMVALDVNTTIQDAVKEFVGSGFSRVPVYQDSVDNTLGLMYAKDLLRVWHEGGEFDSLRDLLRQAYFVPEAKKVDELLEDMQSQRTHIAIVVDEYGGVAGLVTLEDIVEEIFGEIQDEYDLAEESPYQVGEDGDYVFQGRVDLDDFNDMMGSNLPADEADTLGGFIYSVLGRVPDVGEQIDKDNILLTVEQVSARRIDKVRANWKPIDTNKDVSDEAE